MSPVHPVRRFAKVTAFVTRRSPVTGVHELLVFRHPDAGMQLPAGSVDPGERAEAAVLREVAEETGLDETVLVGHLGTTVTDLGAATVFCEDATLRKGPSAEADSMAVIPRGWWCLRIGEQGDHTEVQYEELDRNTDPQRVLVRFRGWVHSDLLADHLERAFFHVHCTGPTVERWRHRAEGRFEFECHWLPLLPMPDIRAPQQQWINAHHEALLRSMERVLA